SRVMTEVGSAPPPRRSPRGRDGVHLHALDRRFFMSRIKSITTIAAVFALAASLAYAQGGTTTPATTTAPAAPAAKSAPAKTHMAAKHAMAKVDINNAAKEDLEKIPGVDDATAD